MAALAHCALIYFKKIKLKKVLKSNEWTVYENLYLKNKTEQEVAKILGYKTSEKNRSPGYKQIKNIKKSIIEKAKEIICYCVIL